MKTWTRMPVFRLLIPFSAGILIGLKHSELKRGTILAFGFIAGLSILFTLRRYGTGKYALRWLAGIPWTGTWLLAGVIAGNIQTATELMAPADNCQGVIVTVDAPLSWSESSVRFLAEMRMIHKDGSWIPWKENAMVSITNGQSITAAPGDLLLLSAVPEQVKQADLTAMFDYREYLRCMGIRYQVRCSNDNVQVLQKSYKAPLKHFAYPVREASSNILHKALPDSAVLGITAALVLGDERWLQKQVEEGYAGAGVLHVLCVSGMHVVLMLSIFERLLSLIRLPTRVSRYKYPFLILLTWYYTSLTGFTPSIVRAAMMMTLVLGAKILNRPNQIPNMLAACMLLLISMNPSFIPRSHGHSFHPFQTEMAF
jgi:competence protein ComEC